MFPTVRFKRRGSGFYFMRVADLSAGSARSGADGGTSAPRREKRRGGRRNRQSTAAASAARAMLKGNGVAPTAVGYPPGLAAQSSTVAPHAPRPHQLGTGLPGSLSQMNLAPVLRPDEQVAATEYDTFLNDLTFNSKDVINSLTKIAGENLPSFNAIAYVLEKRILFMPPHMKLPFLYLVDSICKNIGAVYVNRFRQCIGRCFLCSYECATPPVRASLQRLLNTWPPVFGQPTVDTIRITLEGINGAAQVAASAPVLTPGGAGGSSLLGVAAAVSQMPKSACVAPLNGRVSGHSGPASVPPKCSASSTFDDFSSGHAVPGQHTALLLHIESLFGEAMRKASSGLPPDFVELSTLSTLISSQIQSAGLPPFEREKLRGFSNHITALTSSQRTGRASLAAPSAASAPVAPQGGRLPSHPVRGSEASRVAPNAFSAPAPPARSSGLRSQPSSSAGKATTDLSFTRLKTDSHATIVRSLYADLSFVSKSDGMRFKNQLDLRCHLDWLFVQNKRKRARARAAGGSGVSRCWNETTSSFLGEKQDSIPAGSFGKSVLPPGAAGPAGNDAPGKESPAHSLDGGEQESSLAVTCEARGDDETCPTCCEGFHSSWDDDKQAWMLLDAVRPVLDGPPHHSGCISNEAAESKVAEAVAVPEELSPIVTKTEDEVTASPLSHPQAEAIGLTATTSNVLVENVKPLAEDEEAGSLKRSLVADCQSVGEPVAKKLRSSDGGEEQD